MIFEKFILGRTCLGRFVLLDPFVPSLEVPNGAQLHFLIRISPHVAHIRAREQRTREQIIAVQEMRMLQEEISKCYFKHRVNHYKNCRDLSVEYIRRLSCPNYICDPVRRPNPQTPFASSTQPEPLCLQIFIPPSTFCYLHTFSRQKSIMFVSSSFAVALAATKRPKRIFLMVC
jgi:hypothetical protein